MPGHEPISSSVVQYRVHRSLRCRGGDSRSATSRALTEEGHTLARLTAPNNRMKKPRSFVI